MLGGLGVHILLLGVYRVEYGGDYLTSLYDGSQADGVMIWPLGAA